MKAYLSIVRKLSTDADFRTRFGEDPKAALLNAGVQLGAEDQAALTRMVAMSARKASPSGYSPYSQGGGGGGWGRISYKELTPSTSETR